MPLKLILDHSQKSHLADVRLLSRFSEAGRAEDLVWPLALWGRPIISGAMQRAAELTQRP
jgi:hypothetical protein